jgi:hypothetical protein
MNAHPAPVFHPHHWHVHEEIVAPVPDVVRNPDGNVVHAFWIGSAVYFGLSMASAGLLAAGIIPASAVGGRMLLCLASGFLASAVSLLAGLLYDLPHFLGGGLWSVKLAWTHFAALNVAVLMPLWFLIYDRTIADLMAGEILAVVVILHAGAIGTFIGNMYKSVAHMDWPARGAKS